MLKITIAAAIYIVGAAAREYYVAPEGKANAAGTLADPFPTINAAAEIMKPGDICYIRQGIYCETIRPKQSGTAGSPITFAAYGNEKVLISAADSITGWSLYKDKIYRAPMDWSMEPDENQVYVNGHWMLEARWPSMDWRADEKEYAYLRTNPKFPDNTTPMVHKIGLKSLPEQSIFRPVVRNAHMWDGGGKYFDRLKPGERVQLWIERDNSPS